MIVIAPAVIFSFSWAQVATRITHPLSLAAYGIAAIVALLSRKGKSRIPPGAWVLIGLLVIVPSFFSMVLEMVRVREETNSMYRIRATVVGRDKTPIDDAAVWSSIGGEPKRVPGGWEFDIPAKARPIDGKITVFARLPSAFLTGSTTFTLGGDHFPAVAVQLAAATSARVRGIVVDQSGSAVQGARVLVVGYGSEAIITKDDGGFELNAHAADGQMVELHAEANGRSADLTHPAGDHPARLKLP